MANDSFISFVERFPEHIADARNLGKDITISGVDKVLITGMGGSSISGSLLQAYCAEKAPQVPVYLSRNYDLPGFVDSSTLVIAISYSGNTEETLSAVRSAMRKSAKTVFLTSGGKLKAQAEQLRKPFVEVPEGMQPRAALPYLFIPLLNVLHNAGLIPDPSADIDTTINSIRKASATYRERAQQLAEKLAGKVPLIYASDKMACVAYRWKTQINENAKVHAFTHVFPELNHNELVGYTKLNANYYAILLEDETDHRRVKERIKLTKDIIGSKGTPSTQIVIKGENILTRILSAVFIGDLTSVYLARVTGIDPEPVTIIEDFKKQLQHVPFV